MNIAETLDELKRKAGKDAELKRRILQTRTEANLHSAISAVNWDTRFTRWTWPVPEKAFTRKSSEAPMAAGRIRRS